MPKYSLGKLQEVVLTYSESNNWEEARFEWDIEKCVEGTATCICGQSNLRYLYGIKNRQNGKELYPVGTTCIKRFDHGSSVFENYDVWECLYHLRDDIKRYNYGPIFELNSSIFSKKLFKFMYNIGIFKPTPYNKNDPANDWKFMIDMFNKPKENRSEKQCSKIRAIVMSQIVPWIKSNECRFQE